MEGIRDPPLPPSLPFVLIRNPCSASFQLAQKIFVGFFSGTLKNMCPKSAVVFGKDSAGQDVTEPQRPSILSQSRALDTIFAPFYCAKLEWCPGTCSIHPFGDGDPSSRAVNRGKSTKFFFTSVEFCRTGRPNPAQSSGVSVGTIPPGLRIHRVG